MNRLVWIFLVIALSLGFTFSAVAEETWSCTYEGSWDTTATKNKGDFVWNVQWISTGKAQWHVIGDYEDRYGQSTFDGECKDKKCKFKQSYKNGQLAGSVYYWVGAYTDKWEGDAKTINNFVGTWGEKEKKPTQGKWTATATCTRN